MDDLQHELDSVEKRTRRYWFNDGIVEINGGIVCLLVSGYLLLEAALRGTGHDTLLNLALPALVVLLALLGRWLVPAVKDRYVHPRTGFVSYKRREGHRWARAALAFVIAALMALLFSRAPILRNWIPALEGTAFAVAFFLLGRNVEMLRFPIEGLLCAGVGVIVSVVHLDTDLAAALLFAWLGTVLVGGGLIAFIGYLRQTPPPEQA